MKYQIERRSICRNQPSKLSEGCPCFTGFVLQALVDVDGRRCRPARVGGKLSDGRAVVGRPACGSGPGRPWEPSATSPNQGQLVVAGSAPGETPTDYRVRWAPSGQDYLAYAEAITSEGGSAYPNTVSFTVNNLSSGNGVQGAGPGTLQPKGSTRTIPGATRPPPRCPAHQHPRRNPPTLPNLQGTYIGACNRRMAITLGHPTVRRVVK